jgi:hypothetical protein
MVDAARLGEVVEADTSGFTGECYELYALPPLGGLVRTRAADVEIYAVVALCATTGLEPGRRPVARGHHAAAEADILKENPQIAALMRSEFTAIVIGHRSEGRLSRYLPPDPARIHSFVYECTDAELTEFGQSFGFLPRLLGNQGPVASDELVSACLRQMARVQPDRRGFLVTAGKELAMLLGGEYQRLRQILERIRE